MTIVLAIAFAAVLTGLLVRARRNSARHAASGMLRSPLYWLTSLLTMTLLGLAMYMAYLHQRAPIPILLWIIVAALVPATLVLLRALKWRYPV
ncbi:hypothetical protein [Bradyrhizobium sp. 2TAF24]|uniref:hypothetical protein n=1 Tax=Bradyrhizobium sp. 2TAF24 TaxID=3233011 RepID=UPI003F921046